MDGRIVVAFGLLVVLLATSCAGADCSTYTTCSSCISSADACGWCLTSGSAGCEAAATSTCAAMDFLNPVSAVRSSFTTSSVISPTSVDVFLRLNQNLPVTITITPGPIPLDLVLVEDLSGSMTDDVGTLRNLASEIVTRVRTEIQADTNFGIAGFIDKPMEPIAYHYGCDPESILQNQDCWNYAYEPWLAATADENDFFDALNNELQNHGNRDWPEAMSEGAFHTAICTTAAGWRSNSRHIMLISTDADFHIAGDAELIGVYRPHSELCAESPGDDTYGAGLSQDYPSASLIRDALIRNNVVPIFAVTVGGGSYFPNLPLYQDLVDSWGFGFVYELESDSSNIIDAIIAAYEVTAETVNILVANDEYAWVQSISPSSGYTDALLGVDYPFTVTLRASTGDEGLTTTIGLTSFGFGSIQINATTVYACDCSAVSCPTTGSGVCNGVGVCECGQCQCAGTNFSGIDCACDEAAPCNPPCVNGECKCGACECFADWTGPDCACSTLPCPGNCNGNGNCVCGVCNCTGGFSSFDCSCSNGTACPGTPECSGHGACSGCGTCGCQAGWTGPDCSCSTAPCPSLCSGHGTCNCGTCDCDDDWVDKEEFGSTITCACHNVSCPIEPISGIECGVGGACVCGECVCPAGQGGAACNCSTDPCPERNGLVCSGNGTCVCGECECAPGFSGDACQCTSSSSCPTAVFGLTCSGHGTCDLDVSCGCVCDNGWKHPDPPAQPDCSCDASPCLSTCKPPFGSCDCGVCTCNTTHLATLECTPTEAAACGSGGNCTVRYGTACSRIAECQCASGTTTSAGAVDAFGCACTGDACSLPSCNGAGAVNCSETCGDSCICKPGFVGAACECDQNPAPVCRDNTGAEITCANGGECVYSSVPGLECTTFCQCVEPYSGSDCSRCLSEDVRCPLDCASATCDQCLVEGTDADPRLAQCRWCLAPEGNSSCIKESACNALAGEVLFVCPVARTPSPTLLENKSIFYGGIAAVAVLLLAIVAMIIYKVAIWRADRKLWEEFEASQSNQLTANPLFKAAFSANDNPLYDSEAQAGESFF